MASGFRDWKQERFTPLTQEHRRTKLKVGPAGRVVIPAEMRSALNIKEGDVLLAYLADDELRVVTVDAAIRRSQALIRQSVPQGTKLVDEFLNERRTVWAEDE